MRIDPCAPNARSDGGQGVIHMGLLNVIRRMALREKFPICEIARRTGLSRNTIKKYLNSGTVEPKVVVPERPSKLDPYADKLSACLKAETSKSRKQRRPLTRLHADLRIGHGKERQANMRFLAMENHYVFEPEFCNPAAGWEKGQVEKNVQGARPRLWQPMPDLPNRATLHTRREQRCKEIWQEIPHGRLAGSVADVWAVEQAALMPVPPAFDGFVEQGKRVLPTCLISFERNRLERGDGLRHVLFQLLQFGQRQGIQVDIGNKRPPLLCRRFNPMAAKRQISRSIIARHLSSLISRSGWGRPGAAQILVHPGAVQGFLIGRAVPGGVSHHRATRPHRIQQSLGDPGRTALDRAKRLQRGVDHHQITRLQAKPPKIRRDRGLAAHDPTDCP